MPFLMGFYNVLDVQGDQRKLLGGLMDREARGMARCTHAALVACSARRTPGAELQLCSHYCTPNSCCLVAW
jgi:hypothetical protein